MDWSDFPPEIRELIWSYLDLPSVIAFGETDDTRRRYVDAYLSHLLRSGGLEECGNAYTEEGQHHGIPEWKQIGNDKAFFAQHSDNTEGMIRRPTGEDLSRLRRQILEGMVRLHESRSASHEQVPPSHA